MAAIDLERGLEHGGRGWGNERPDLMDSFDSEMQEWEDQLQDIQRKIEELYNEVQARRNANNITSGNQKNGSELDCGRGLHGNSHPGKNPSGPITVPHHYSNGCNYSDSGYSYLGRHQNGYSYCHSNGVSEIGELLQDYLGQGKQGSQKNSGARHVHFNDKIKVSRDIPPYTNEDRRSPRNERFGQEQFFGSFEENENMKNHMTSCLSRESSPNKENSWAKPPPGQRDVPTVQLRSQLSGESPSVERKSFSPGILGDRKCGSPSVLRRFGAMLQENEGKLLTESGVVTHYGLAPEPKCSTPVCQRKAPGVAGRLATEGSPQLSQKKPQVSGSPKVSPRANSAVDKVGRLTQGERARKPSTQYVEPKMDYTVSSASTGAQRIHWGGLTGHDCSQARDEGLIELLDMLEIQHEYSFNPRSGHMAYRDDPQHVNPAQMSPSAPNRSFSRPARPANQRPPSRWASSTPTARITSPTGPIYHLPSPLARPPSPMARTPSPAVKHRPRLSYSLQTETVIM